MKNKHILVLIILFCVQTTFSQNDEFKTVSVSVFKNGTAFLKKETTLNTDNDKTIFTKLPKLYLTSMNLCSIVVYA